MILASASLPHNTNISSYPGIRETRADAEYIM